MKSKNLAAKLLQLEITEENPTVTIEDLLDDFYIIHKVKQKELHKKYRGQQFAVRPIQLVKNPLGFGREAVLPTSVWVAIYYKHYFVRIECGSSVFNGPHKAELYWQMKRGTHIRLGSFQITGGFHNERKIRKALKFAILKKKYFASQITLETVIEILPEQETHFNL